MRLLLDTDILLDFVLERVPHHESSGKILEWAESHPGSCAVAWHSLANIHYLTRGNTRGFFRDLLQFIEVPRTGGDDMLLALELGFSDLEDAMQCASAILFGAQMIVTRNISDYKKSPIKAVTPSFILNLLSRDGKIL